MLEELSILVRLQSIDNQLIEIEEDKGDLPEQIKVLEDKYNQHEQAISENEKKQITINQQRKEIELSLGDARDRLKRSQSTIFSVKTTREYDAITSEIEHAKNRIADGERKLIELQAEGEELSIQQASLREELDRVKTEYSDRKAEMQERMDSSHETETKLRKEREKTIKLLKKPIYSHYDRIRKIRDGIGVSYICDNACSYCFSRIPPQRQAEIRTSENFFLCETCGCILVSEEIAQEL